MPATYENIATTTLTSAQSTVTFSSISSAFTDLIAVIEGTFTNANDLPALRLNSDSGSNYSQTVLRGNGSAAASTRFTSQTVTWGGDVNSAAGSRFIWTVHLQNYSNTTTNKTLISRHNNATSETGTTVHLYRSTSAISAIEFRTLSSSTYASGTIFTLYGIKAA